MAEMHVCRRSVHRPYTGIGAYSVHIDISAARSTARTELHTI